MQALATELGIAETAFVMPDERSRDTFDLRWFSPLVEIDLCGHATLASAHALRAARAWWTARPADLPRPAAARSGLVRG